MFVINPTAQEPLKLILQRLWLTDTLVAVSVDILDKLVDTLQDFFILSLPIQVIFSGMIRPDFNHRRPQSVHGEYPSQLQAAGWIHAASSY